VSKGLQRCDGTLSLSDYSAYLSRIRRADERTRTADLTSLRVCGQPLQGFAQGSKYRIPKRLSFLCLALCCTVLRSRWYQSGIKRSDSYSLMAGPMTRTRDLRSHNPPTSVATCCGTLQDRLIYTSFFARGCPPFLHVARSVVSAVVSSDIGYSPTLVRLIALGISPGVATLSRFSSALTSVTFSRFLASRLAL
jgi:hypothetical protein